MGARVCIFGVVGRDSNDGSVLWAGAGEGESIKNWGG
jgi:hypothetical protein